jgi:thiamine-phosphate pyrophosphorylase
MKKTPEWTLYLITDSAKLTESSYWKFLDDALRQGVTMLQFRFSGLTDRNACELSARALALCRKYDVPLIVNNRTDIAMAIGADGVHLGRDDIPAGNVRKIWKGILGATAHTLDEAREAQENGADYIGWGCIFPSSTKEISRIAGPESIRMVKRVVRIPVIAIGGITPDNLHSVLAMGADGIASIAGLNTGGAEPYIRAIDAFRRAM